MLGSLSFAQTADTKSLLSAVADFDNALINADSTALKQLLSDKVSYGHSNGWVETKKEVIADLYNGKLDYKKISASDIEVKTEGSTAWTRMVADIDVLMDGRELNFKLKVLQVWVWKNKRWQLFARQSLPMPKEK